MDDPAGVAGESVCGGVDLAVPAGDSPAAPFPPCPCDGLGNRRLDEFDGPLIDSEFDDLVVGGSGMQVSHYLKAPNMQGPDG